MSRVTSASNATISTAAARGQEDDAVAEGQPVAAGVQLAREQVVPGQDRAEHREAVERGVGGEHEDQRRWSRRPGRTPAGSRRRAPWRSGRSPGPGRSRAPTGWPSCERAAVAGSSANRRCMTLASMMMLMSMVTAMAPSRASVVAAFLLLGILKAGTPLLIASTPVSAAQPEREGPQQQEGPGQPGEAARRRRTRADLAGRRSRPVGQVAEREPDEPDEPPCRGSRP